MASTWPTAVATDANLYLAVNELQTNLSSGINNSVTTITLNSTTSFPTVGLVLIDNEIIKYTGISGSDLTGCTRGFDGTSAASHSSAAIVSFAICAAHHNVLKDEIKAIEQTLADLVGLSATLPLTVSLPVQTDSNGHLTASAITLSSSGVTGTLPIAKGGTNSSTALGGHKAIVSDASKLVESATTDTEISYVAGVTSAIQTQMDTKYAKAGGQLTGNLSFDNNSTHGVVGTATNDNAAAGNIGEAVRSYQGTGQGLGGNNTWGDVTSISLTAGDWDISAFWIYEGTATITELWAAISTHSGNDGTGTVIADNYGSYAPAASSVMPTQLNLSVPSFRVSLSGTTTYYMKMGGRYSSGTPAARGRISARRIR